MLMAGALEAPRRRLPKGGNAESGARSHDGRGHLKPGTDYVHRGRPEAGQKFRPVASGLWRPGTAPISGSSPCGACGRVQPMPAPIPLSSGTITGWLAGAGLPHPVRLAWHEGRITEVAPAPPGAAADVHLAPPLCDLQVNGYAGIDFQQDDLEVEALLQAVRALRRDGCTRFLLTLITDEWPRLVERLRHLARQRLRHPELTAAIAGWHLEGPFLSTEPGYVGAHDPACMVDPTDAHVDALRALAGGCPLLLTLSPERAGAVGVIRRARERGVLVQPGHTNASAAVLREIAAPGTFFTHLGNGCPQQLDRHDNILWRVLDLNAMGASLIPDGIHVSPVLFRLIHQLKAGRLYYTTDAMSAAGAPPGHYRLGRLEVEVGADGVVRQPGRTNFAGSSCTPVAGVFRAASMLGAPWEEAWHRFSAVPAGIIGLPTRLQVGGPAEFCVLRWPEGATEFGGLPELETIVASSAAPPRTGSGATR